MHDQTMSSGYSRGDILYSVIPIGFILWILIGLLSVPAAAQDESIWTAPRAVLQAEIGIDSLQRRTYRPRFSFSWPLAVRGWTRAVFDVSYLQRINGDMEGDVDYWVYGGLEARLTLPIQH